MIPPTMARSGRHRNLLEELHARGCDGTEYSACRPAHLAEDVIVVFYMEWCGACGAADYERV